MVLSPIMSGLLVFVHIIVVTYSKQIFRLLKKAHYGKVPLKDKLLLFIGDLFSTIVVLIAVINPASNAESNFSLSINLLPIPIGFIIILMVIITLELFVKRANK